MKSNYESELEEILYQNFNFDFVCLRHELGLTQQEMADKSHVLRDKIAKIERGIYPPNIKSVLRILGPLGYTLKIELPEVTGHNLSAPVKGNMNRFIKENLSILSSYTLLYKNEVVLEEKDPYSSCEWMWD